MWRTISPVTLIIYLLGICVASANSRVTTADFTAWFSKLHTLTASYQQVTKDDQGHVLQKSHGNLALSQPKHLYWLSRGDQNYEIVTEGVVLWYYDHDLSQVIRQKFDRLPANNPVWLLSGDRSIIASEYRTTVLGSRQHFRVTLTAISPDSPMPKAEFIIEENILKQLIFLDLLDQTTTITLSDQKVNLPITPTRFQFVPPKGVDIIDQMHT